MGQNKPLVLPSPVYIPAGEEPQLRPRVLVPLDMSQSIKEQLAILKQEKGEKAEIRKVSDFLKKEVPELQKEFSKLLAGSELEGALRPASAAWRSLRQPEWRAYS